MSHLEKPTNSQEMRFLLTQDCNYRCSFCHGEGLQNQKQASLAPDDYRFLFNVGLEHFNMQTCTFTGGEPLFRKDVIEIAELIKAEGGLITVTTNGSLLDERIDLGQHVQRVNISLNSLDAEKYEEMVGRKNMSTRVRAAISAFRAKYPDVHMIFNTTLIKGFNYILEDMVKIISFANEVGASIKFIELFPMKAENFVSLQKVQELLTVLEFSSVESNSQRKVVLSNGPMSVALTRILCSQAILSETPSEFCYRNNDLFISPDGSIKPCRELLQEVHLLEPIKDRDRLQTADQIKEALLAIGKNCQYNEP